MKAAVLFKTGQPLEIVEVELGTLGPREVLVKVKASGLCHSDLHVMNNDFGWPLPAVLGHEMAGIVEEIGKDVTSVSVGDHVVGNLISSCGECKNCRRGKQTTCTNPESIHRSPGEAPKITFAGKAVAQLGDIGGFAEKSILHERNLVTIPAEIPFAKAALLGCAVMTGVGAAKNSAQVRFGDTVAVIGCGGVGLNVVQGAAISGARRIIAIDLQQEKLELALKFGATDVINPATVDDVVARVREIVGARGVDHAFEVIGMTKTAQQAIEITDVGGSAYMLGLQAPGNLVSMGPYELLRGQKSLRGVHMGTSVAEVDIPLYADLYLQGRLNLDDLVAHTITLQEINEGYAELEKGKTARSVILFD